MKPSVIVTDLALLPVVLLLSDVAAVYRLSIPTIRRRLHNGTFSPRPWATYPYRWRREDVVAELNHHRPEQPPKPHGFAAVKARRQKKAALDSLKTQARTAS